MRSKFIEGTDKKYSIREDGIVIQHYKYYRNQYSSGKIIKDKECKIGKYGYVYPESCLIFIPHKLLAEYFGFKYCECGNKFKPNTINELLCSNCKTQTRKTWVLNNQDKIKKSRKKFSNKDVSNIGKGYVQSKLKLKQHELTDEIYNCYKKTLEFKREISKKHGIPVNLLK